MFFRKVLNGVPTVESFAHLQLEWSFLMLSLYTYLHLSNQICEKGSYLPGENFP